MKNIWLLLLLALLNTSPCKSAHISYIPTSKEAQLYAQRLSYNAIQTEEFNNMLQGKQVNSAHIVDLLDIAAIQENSYLSINSPVIIQKRLRYEVDKKTGALSMILANPLQSDKFNPRFYLSNPSTIDTHYIILETGILVTQDFVTFKVYKPVNNGNPSIAPY